MMRYQLVIQADHKSLPDYDVMILLEQKIEERLEAGDFVDGHDAGSGEWNIFLDVADPHSTWSKLAPLFEGETRGIRVAYRELEGSKYTALFPASLSRFSLR